MYTRKSILCINIQSFKGFCMFQPKFTWNHYNSPCYFILLHKYSQNWFLWYVYVSIALYWLYFKVRMVNFFVFYFICFSNHNFSITVNSSIFYFGTNLHCYLFVFSSIFRYFLIHSNSSSYVGATQQPMKFHNS